MLALTIEQEKELIGRCVAGQKAAWDQFVSQYSKMVYSCIYRSWDKNTPEFVEELYQEVFLAFLKDDFKKLKSFGWKNNSSFSTWLRPVIKNLVRDYFRKLTNQTRRQSPLDATMDPDERDKRTLLDQQVDQQPSASEKLYEKEKIQLVIKQMEKLSASDQLLIRLIYDDTSVEDIAKHMNKSVEAIYMQKTRVLGKLRRELQKKNVSN